MKVSRIVLVPILALVASAWIGNSEPDIEEDWHDEIVSRLLLQGVSLLAGQKFEPNELTPVSFKELALTDSSNDDIVQATRQQIIRRSGYGYENHNYVSPDGYITQLIRIINPLAERRHLKGPPVMLLQGGITDQTVWIWSSAIQHHPERFPRRPQDGPISSYNRSLAFTLANNGYDVWLVGTRGSNADNLAHTRYSLQRAPLGSWSRRPPSGQSAAGAINFWDLGHQELAERLGYWNFTFDELALLELPGQIDLVLELTGASNVSLVPLSFSGLTLPMTLAERPDYMKKLHNTVAVGPVAGNAGTSNLVNSYERTLCRLLPDEIGTLLITEFLLSETIRRPLRRLASSPKLRYSLLKAAQLILTGPSSQYHSFLEPAVYGNLFLPTSFKQLKHFCQVATAGRYQKFDYGPRHNKRIYGTSWPKKYDTSASDLGNWLMVSAQNDVLAPRQSISDFIGASKTKPLEHLRLEHYSHLDLIAAFDQDVRVNLPILSFLDRFHLAPEQEESSALGQDNIDFNRVR